MERGERIRGEIVFAALYLPGLAQFAGLMLDGRIIPRGGRLPQSLRLELEPCQFGHGEQSVNRKRWPVVERILRQENWGLDQVGGGLRKHGFVEESSRLELPGMQTLATLVVENGFCLTPWHLSYPRAWLQTLGALSPPAVWCGCRSDGQSCMRDDLSYGSGLGRPLHLNGGSEEWNLSLAGMAAIVGARDAGIKCREQVAALARVMAGAGWGLCSGGAIGVDFAAMSAYEMAGGMTAVELLPFGLWSESFASQNLTPRSKGSRPMMEKGSPGMTRDGGERESVNLDVVGRGTKIFLSVVPPLGSFTVRAAMERNALIYAGVDHTVVVSPKYKTGGTWHGACDALRRRLCPVILAREDSISVRALLGLGAAEMPFSADEHRMRSAWEAARASLCRGYGQPELFGGFEVREPQDGYQSAG